SATRVVEPAVLEGDPRKDAAAESTASVAPSAGYGAEVDGEDTQLHNQLMEGPDSLAPLHAPEEEGSPPAPITDIPERPLFASTERRVPASTQAGHAASAGSAWTE